MIERSSLLHLLTIQTAPIVIINGLPGSGKSVLLQQLAAYFNCKVQNTLPNPSEFEDNTHLIWDTIGRGFHQHLEQVLQLRSELENREQTLFISASWVGNNKLISQALLYGQLAIIDQSELMFSEQEIASLYPSDYTNIYLHTRGWPVLVSNWSDLNSERYKESLREYIAARILPILSYHEQRLLIALAFNSEISTELVRLEKTHIEMLDPLIIEDRNSNFTLGIPYLKQVLVDIAKPDSRVYQEAMRLVVKHIFHHKDHFIAIQTALESNNIDLAIQWFEECGGGMYGYLHGFAKLEQILNLFSQDIIASNLNLCLAKAIFYFKNYRLLEAKEFIGKLDFDKNHLKESDRAIMTLIRGQYDTYFTTIKSDVRIDKLKKIEFQLVSNSDALMIYYGMLSIHYSMVGDWSQASLYQHKELALASKSEVSYLVFYCHFNLARINLRMGYPKVALQHVKETRKSITRISYYKSLSYEKNFADLIDGITALYRGDIELANKQWNRSAILRKHSEIWPEFLFQFYFFGVVCHLINNETEQTSSLLDQLRFEYQLFFSDDQGKLYFKLLSILILQQQQRWTEGQAKLSSIDIDPESAIGPIIELYHWLTYRNNVGLVCIHSRQQGTTVSPELNDTPWSDICYTLQELKLLWFSHDQFMLAPRLLSLFRRAYTLDLWLPLMFEMEWLNHAVKKVKSSAKNRIRHTLYERAFSVWNEKCQQTPKNSQTEELTSKQLVIVQRLGEGLSNKKIAQFTGLSESTVKFHLKGLFKRFGVESRQSLVKLAMEKGWIH
ncbi:LuxR C-terminal-related transcriptional regulator [Marinomonas sp. 5E14-1]|uniref:response regulator transcription factor n=1 Tax=Marinomonas sp. 5E14-1 TaxID=3153922 RepID=UPI003264B168